MAQLFARWKARGAELNNPLLAPVEEDQPQPQLKLQVPSSELRLQINTIGASLSSRSAKFMQEPSAKLGKDSESGSPTSHFNRTDSGELSPATPQYVDPDFDPFNHEVKSCGVVPVFEALIALPLILFRVVLLLFLGIIVLPVFFLPLIGVKFLESEPFPPWRRHLLLPARWCARTFLFALGYQRVKVEGKPASRSEAPIIVANHLSFVDPLFCFYYLLPVILSAKENANIPIIGTLLKACQIIPVDRTDAQSRRIATEEIQRRASDDRWPHIMIFPEGTTTNGRAMVAFRLGAFSPGLPVQPMVIEYPTETMHPAWVRDGPSISYLLFRLIFRLNNNMTVKFLPVVTPTEEEKQDPPMFAERVRSLMAASLGVPLTNHTFWGASRNRSDDR